MINLNRVGKGEFGTAWRSSSSLKTRICSIAPGKCQPWQRFSCRSLNKSSTVGLYVQAPQSRIAPLDRSAQQRVTTWSTTSPNPMLLDCDQIYSHVDTYTGNLWTCGSTPSTSRWSNILSVRAYDAERSIPGASCCRYNARPARPATDEEEETIIGGQLQALHAFLTPW